VSVIAAACRDSECLRFGYRSRDGTDSRREVEPYASTMVAAGIWSPGIVAARTGAHSASTAWLNQRRPAGVSSRAGCRRKMRPRTSSKALPGRQTDSRRWSRCTAAENIASRVPRYWGAIKPIDAHTCQYRTGDDDDDDDLRWLALRIVHLEVDFEVHEPPELIEHLRTLGSRLTRATR
jgi:predicted DNA-binding transcriptional regulator YafY